jgi:CheY-like chemotaxis protein
MSPSAAPRRVLLVDDARLDVELALDAFNELQLSGQVDVARGGSEALERLLGVGPFADRVEHPLPDLVLMDLKMPGVDGFEVLRQCKTSPATRRIPVIVLSSSTEDRDRARAYDLGANSYLVKPISIDGFLDALRLVRDYWLGLDVGPPPADRVPISAQ